MWLECAQIRAGSEPNPFQAGWLSGSALTDSFVSFPAVCPPSESEASNDARATASPVQRQTPPAPLSVKEGEDGSPDRTKEEAEPCVNGDEPPQLEVRQRVEWLAGLFAVVVANIIIYFSIDAILRALREIWVGCKKNT